jgi:hypothetical protein
LLTAKEEQLKTVRAFIQNNLGKELLATYDSLWIRNNPERAQIIAENSLENAEENNNNHTL